MSQRVLIIHIDVVIPVQWERALQKFGVTNGMEKEPAHTYFFHLALDLFQKGLLSSKKMKERLTERFPLVGKIPGLFERAWTSACELSQASCAALQEIDALTQQGFRVILLGDIDNLQHSCIQSQYGSSLPGERYFSYEQHQQGSALFDSLLEQLDKEGVNSHDIAVFYNTPPAIEHKNWFENIVSWLVHPQTMSGQIKAQQSLAWMEQKQRNSEFVLVNCDKATRALSLTSKLSRIGWLQEQRSFSFSPTPSYLPMHGTSQETWEPWVEPTPTTTVSRRRDLQVK
jgi:hypothetical protein